MDEDEIRKRDLEGKRIIAEGNERREKLKKEITELAKSEQVPVGVDGFDALPFYRGKNGHSLNGLSYSLLKKMNEKELYVKVEKGTKVENELKITDYMQTFQANEIALLQLKSQLPDFIHFLATKDPNHINMKKSNRGSSGGDK